MTECPCSCVCRRLIAAALTAACLWQSFEAASGYFQAGDAYSYYDSWRSAARHAPRGSLALLGADAACIDPTDRSRLIAISWERAPVPISLVDTSSDLRSFDSVLSSRWHSSSAGKRLEREGFSVVETNEYAKTWVKKGAACSRADSSASAPSLTRELFASLLEFLVMLVGCWLVAGRRCFAGCSFIVAVLVVAALGFTALSHTLLAPNGLGVYGGKAKLLFLCGGVPSEYLASSGGAVLQSAYPPGLTALAYLHFALSGGCGDRLVQLLPVFATGLLCFILTRDVRHRLMMLPAVLFCLSPVAIRLTSGFYAEPFVAFLLVTGWGMMREGRVRTGSLVMGLAGLFRPEAGVVAVVFATSGSLFRGGFAAAVPVAAASAAVPTILWLVVCTVVGLGVVQDWNFMSVPQMGLIVRAAGVLLKALCTQAFPVFMVAVLVGSWSVSSGRDDRVDGLRRNRRARLSAVAATAMVLLVIPLACGFYSARSADWMFDHTIPRLVWYLVAIPVFEISRMFARGSKMNTVVRDAGDDVFAHRTSRAGGGDARVVVGAEKVERRGGGEQRWFCLLPLSR